MRVAIAGGGTAGHVFPGLALAEWLATAGHDVTFIGTSSGPERRLALAAGFRFETVEALPFVRKVSMSSLRAPVVALGAVSASRGLLRGVDRVVGMGGYASVPAVLAAWREGTPAVLHEQNAVPGLANRALSRVASSVALAFPQARSFFGRRRRVVVTGNPVRERIVRVRRSREALAAEARKELELDEARSTVVVFGGSQGALHLGRSAVGACRLLADRRDLQILLITGPAHLSAVRESLAGPAPGLLVRVTGFLERMELSYALADLVVSRAGASTVAELAVCGLPSVLVPYPYATRQHQEANARALAADGGARVMLDAEVTPESLSATIAEMIDDDRTRRGMGEAASAFGRPDAAHALGELVLAAGP